MTIPLTSYTGAQRLVKLHLPENAAQLAEWHECLWQIAKESKTREEFIAKMEREGALENGWFAGLYIAACDAALKAEALAENYKNGASCYNSAAGREDW